MSALASLVHAYDRLAERGEAPEFGYARTNISFVIILDLDGNPTCMPVDIREPQGKKQNLVGKRLDVPTFLTQRTSGIAPNFLWDKTSYSLGIIEEDLKKPVAKQAKEVSRALETHAAFVALHTNLLSETIDEGLRAFMQFLRVWKPEEFEKGGWPMELKGENVVFSLDGDVGRRYIHERPAARELWTKLLASEPSPDAVCLISGAHSRIGSKQAASPACRPPRSSRFSSVCAINQGYSILGRGLPP